MPDLPDRPHLARFRALAELLDARFRVPGTPIRCGWDALLGLLPGVGDVAGGVAGAYGLYAGYALGAPAPVLLRMTLNLGVDLLIGTLPLLGDLFDVGWRGNLRNVALLERWLAEPGRTARRSTGLVVGLLLLLLGMVAGVVVLLGWVVRGILTSG